MTEGKSASEAPWPAEHTPKKLLEHYLKHFKTEHGRTFAEAIADFQEQKSIEHECFSKFGRTQEHRANYKLYIEKLDTAIELLLTAARKAIVDGLIKGAVMAVGSYSPHEAEDIIPPKYWPFLELDFDTGVAVGEIITFRNVRLIQFSEFSDEQRDLVNDGIGRSAAKIREFELSQNKSSENHAGTGTAPVHAPDSRMFDLNPTHLEDWRRGVSLERAAELLAPNDWAAYRATYIPLIVLGDPQSGNNHRRAMQAFSRVRDALWSRLSDGILELRTLQPPEDPAARWTPVSGDVLGAIERETINFDASTIKLPAGRIANVRVVLASLPSGQSEATSHASPSTNREPKRSAPTYTRVSEAWEVLPEEVKARVGKWGGKKEVAQIIHAEMPEVPIASVEREFRQVLKDKRESGDKAET